MYCTQVLMYTCMYICIHQLIFGKDVWLVSSCICTSSYHFFVIKFFKCPLNVVWFHFTWCGDLDGCMKSKKLLSYP